MPLILDTPPGSPIGQAPDVNEERRRLHHDADVVIVGAGILGSALAVALGDVGRSVILLEKSLKEPDRIVGELLQPGGVEVLSQLGLRHCLEGIDAITVKGYEVIYQGEPVEIKYPPSAASTILDTEESQPAQTNAQGRSFHHGRFVRRLRESALKHPNVTVFETEVVSTITSTLTTDNSSQIIGVQTLTAKTTHDYFFGSLTVICDGYASKFRKQYLPPHLVPIAKSKFWALELIDCPLPKPTYGHVVVSPTQAPVLFYQIGTHETRALIDVPENTPAASVAQGGVKNYLENHVLPSLPAAIQPSFATALEAKGALRSMPNSFLPSSTNRTPGLALVGDALNMRHPLTGGGMTVALNDVLLLKTLLDPATTPDLDNTASVLAAFELFHWQRKNFVGVINILAQALYSLFAANDPQLRYLQRGCFAYFKKGGQYIAEPAGLLAGIFTSRMMLYYHFFSVALLGIWLLFLDNGFLGFVSGYSALQGVLTLYKACVVLLPFVWAEMKA